MVAHLATGWEHGGGPWEVPDMQAVQALRITGERRLTHGDDVRPVLGGDQRNEAILPDEGVVIARGQLEPLRVQDRDTRVEKRQAQANSLHLNSDPLPFLRPNLVIVDVFLPRDAVDRHIDADQLGPGEIVIGFDLRDVAQRSHAEGLERADPRRGANTKIVQAQPRSVRDLEGGNRLGVIAADDLGDCDSRLIEEDFLDVGEALAGDRDGHLGATLAADGLDESDGGGDRPGGHRRDEKYERGENNRFHDDRRKVSVSWEVND